jgi:hypothetical protein
MHYNIPFLNLDNAWLKLNFEPQGSGQAAFILSARDFNSPETLQVWGNELSIEQHKIPPAQMFNQVDQGNLTGVCRTAKHALTGKQPTERYPVQATLELSIDPNLDTVGKAQTMQLNIRIDDLAANPSSLTGRAYLGASGYHRSKIGIEPNLKAASSNSPSQSFGGVKGLKRNNRP